MTDKDEQPDAGVDDFDKAARLNFRDYPSTSLVMFAALSSGLGWVLYRWLGRKRADQRAVPNGGGETVGNAPQAERPTNGSAEAEQPRTQLMECSGVQEGKNYSQSDGRIRDAPNESSSGSITRTHTVHGKDVRRSLAQLAAINMFDAAGARRRTG